MSDEDRNNTLVGLKDDILNSLAAVSDQIINADNLDFETILVLARSTENTNILRAAVEKAKKIEDPVDRLNASLAVIDEIDFQLSKASGTEHPANDNNQEPNVDNQPQQ
jgi:hypothetical protein